MRGLNVNPLEDEPTLEVTWDSVAAVGNCELTYIVTWTIPSSPDEEGTSDVSEPHYNITGLRYYTEYHVCVTPSAEGMQAPKSCKTETTVTGSKLRERETTFPHSCFVRLSVSYCLCLSACQSVSLSSVPSVRVYESVFPVSFCLFLHRYVCLSVRIFASFFCLCVLHTTIMYICLSVSPLMFYTFYITIITLSTSICLFSVSLL